MPGDHPAAAAVVVGKDREAARRARQVSEDEAGGGRGGRSISITCRHSSHDHLHGLWGYTVAQKRSWAQNLVQSTSGLTYGKAESSTAGST